MLALKELTLRMDFVVRSLQNFVLYNQTELFGRVSTSIRPAIKIIQK